MALTLPFTFTSSLLLLGVHLVGIPSGRGLCNVWGVDLDHRMRIIWICEQKIEVPFSRISSSSSTTQTNRIMPRDRSPKIQRNYPSKRNHHFACGVSRLTDPPKCCSRQNDPPSYARQPYQPLECKTGVHGQKYTWLVLGRKACVLHVPSMADIILQSALSGRSFVCVFAENTNMERALQLYSLFLDLILLLARFG